ncbi:MAG TPA: Gfo/Idh/MocA family oxidoreductase [Acidimicrobiales bacterium]|nr:Gfo/Idh/MocA family oxidoreductase [Acidimicrobiales bacterium]
MRRRSSAPSEESAKQAMASPAGAVRWGVVGATATIGRLAVLPAIAASPTSQLVAAATRAAAGLDDPASDPELAASMAPFDLAATGARISAHYGDVIDDPEVEAVYIPLPNGLHAEWTFRAAAAGKHVLCEKPLSAYPAEARAMRDACAQAGVVLAEAYMTAFHPRARAVVDLAASGGFGALRFAHAAFTFPLANPDDHRWDPVLGSGALADVGVYCLAPLVAAAGRQPVDLAAAARVTSSGVDASISAWLDFGDGFGGAVECSFEAPERQVLELVGTDAWVSVDRAFTPGTADTGFDVHHRDGRMTRVETGGVDPYRAMIDAFTEVVRAQANPERSVAEAVALLELADRLRIEAGAPLAPLPVGTGRHW